MRHPRLGAPAEVLRAAFAALDRKRIKLRAASPIHASAPIGPSQRRYANAAAMISTRLGPSRLLARLKRIEARFGRKHRGMRWRARVLDLDIILWSGGTFSSRQLVIPHQQFRSRPFVLKPAKAIAAAWRDPSTGLTIQHLTTRLTRPRPALRALRSRNASRLGGP